MAGATAGREEAQGLRAGAATRGGTVRVGEGGQLPQQKLELVVEEEEVEEGEEAEAEAEEEEGEAEAQGAEWVEEAQGSRQHLLLCLPDIRLLIPPQTSPCPHYHHLLLVVAGVVVVAVRVVVVLLPLLLRPCRRRWRCAAPSTASGARSRASRRSCRCGRPSG
jgi:hypothetical protein